jgi:surface polysaccharide O-acyltransferase-like enzyme
LGLILSEPVPQSRIPADLIRTIAIVLVIVLHAAIETHPIVTEINQAEVYRWWTVNFYSSIARPCIPLFVLLTGSLLLTPEKTTEPLPVFFKKRWNRIALPFIFWAVIYFAWTYFINNGALTLSDVTVGLLNAPYYHFWFLYLLVGLYLLTPILRVVASYAQRKTLKFFLILWFIGTAVVPIFDLVFEGFSVSSQIFIIVDWIGYYLLGAYLLKVQVKKLYLFIAVFIGFLWTMVGTYYATWFFGGTTGYFFYDYMAINVVITSIALFMLLLSVPKTQLPSKPRGANRLIKAIGQNSLPIFLIHVIILESLQKGLFGFTISINTINPAIEIPLITVVTLFSSLAIVLALKKIPFMKKLIG